MRMEKKRGVMVLPQSLRIITSIVAFAVLFSMCVGLLQLIRQNDTGVDYYIEINPRFGGGAPLSIKAGADSAQALMQLLQGASLIYQPNAAEDGAVYSRFDQSVRVQ